MRSTFQEELDVLEATIQEEGALVRESTVQGGAEGPAIVQYLADQKPDSGLRESQSIVKSYRCASA